MKNMGILDRSLRVVLAVVIAVLYYLGQISGTAAWILGIVAIIFFLTGLVGVCPLYIPFKCDTRKKE